MHGYLKVSQAKMAPGGMPVAVSHQDTEDEGLPQPEQEPRVLFQEPLEHKAQNHFQEPPAQETQERFQEPPAQGVPISESYQKPQQEDLFLDAFHTDDWVDPGDQMGGSSAPQAPPRPENLPPGEFESYDFVADYLEEPRTQITDGLNYELENNQYGHHGYEPSEEDENYDIETAFSPGSARTIIHGDESCSKTRMDDLFGKFYEDYPWYVLERATEYFSEWEDHPDLNEYVYNIEKSVNSFRLGLREALHPPANPQEIAFLKGIADAFAAFRAWVLWVLQQSTDAKATMCSASACDQSAGHGCILVEECSRKMKSCLYSPMCTNFLVHSGEVLPRVQKDHHDLETHDENQLTCSSIQCPWDCLQVSDTRCQGIAGTRSMSRRCSSFPVCIPDGSAPRISFLEYQWSEPVQCLE
ncbi:unnamed protein product [Notodromas monacha]|uniref:Uncharacterized protein n=1 Tax=Notodromas monacha TaxID=399045 RepID=A0A7R9BU28_9CRUS|nr:unnamed protein product [Notodromas monacha]CAG0921432.1 unnamed protein product [Notodromas monacha]